MSKTPESNTLIDIGETQLTRNNTRNNINNTGYLERNTWRSCCGMAVDKRILLFSCQASISIITLTLCVYMLITHKEDCDSNQLYSNILMMILGVWLPQPNMKK